MNYKRWRRIYLTEHHQSTGKYDHLVNFQDLPLPKELQIVQLLDTSGFYLLYLDHNGVEMSDTWHKTLGDALKQAELEFDIKPDEWEILNR